MKKLLKMKHWQFFLIFYSVPIYQIANKSNLVVNGFQIGVFPFLCIYFGWIVILMYTLKPNKNSFTLIAYILLFAICFFALLLFLLSWNMSLTSDNPMYRFYTGISALFLSCILLIFWICLSFRIKRLLQNSSVLLIFIFCLLGPFSIWFLQPKITHALENIDK